MPDYDGGTAFVRFVPSFRGAQAAVRAEARKWAQSIEDELQRGITRGIRGGAGQAGAQGGQAGTAYGQSFGETVRQRISAALRNLPNPRIDANSTPAQRKIADLRAQLRTLQARVGVDIDSGQALARIATISAELQTLASSDPSVDVRVDASRALAQLQALQAEVDRIDGQNATVDVRLEGGFAQRIKAQIEGALQDLPEARIDVNTGQADTQIESLRARLTSLGNQRIGVDIDAGRAMTELAALEAELDAMAANDLRLDVRVDAAAARARLQDIRREVEQLDGQDADIDVNVDRDGSAARGFSGILVAGLALGPALIPVMAALVPAIAGIGLAAVGAVAGIGVLVLAFSGVIAAVKAMSEARKNAAKENAAAAKAEQQHAQQVSQAQQQLRSAEDALTQARRQAAQSAEDAAQRVTRARRAETEAVAAAAKDQADAERDVADAVRDAGIVREQVAQAAQRASRDVTDARRQESDAERDAAQAAETASRAVADARRNVEDVTRQTAATVQRALERQADAEHTLETAQRRAREAQEALTQARRDAQDQLEDLESRAANGALAERDAVFDLADKTEALRRTRESLAAGESGFTQDDVDRALLKYDEAVQALKDIQRENGRTAEAQQEANAKGVEGSDQVVAAQQALADAQHASEEAAKDAAQARQDAAQAELDRTRQLADAQRAVDDALKDQTRTQEQSAERLTLAHRAVTDALEAQRRGVLEGQRQIEAADRRTADAEARRAQARIDATARVRDAREQLADAVRTQDRAAESSAHAVAQAEEGVARAMEGVRRAAESNLPAATTSAQKLAQAMAGLSPAGRRFASFIYDELRPALGGLRDAAQEGLLPGLQNGLAALLPFMPKIVPVVRDIAQALGGLFETGLKALTAPFWRDFFGWLAEILPSLIVNLGQSLGHLLTGLAGLLKGLAPLGFAFLDGVSGALEKFSNWAQQLDGDSSFRNFFAYLQEVMPLVREALLSIAGAAGHLIQALAPIGGVILFALGKVADFIHAIPLPLLTVLAGGFIAVAAAVWLVNAAFAANPVTLIALAFVALVAAVAVAYQNVQWFHDAVDATWNGIKWLWDNVLAPTFDAIGKSFLWLWESVLSPTLDAIGKGFRLYWDYYLHPILKLWAWYFTDVVGPALTWLWEKVVAPVLDAIGKLFRLYWDYYLHPILDAFKFAIDLVGDAFGLAKTAISTAWNGIQTAVAAGWNLGGTGLKVVLGFVESAVGAVKTGFDTAKTGIGLAWEAVRSVVAELWTREATGLKVVLGFVESAVGAVGSAFDTAKTAIGKAWSAVGSTVGDVWDDGKNGMKHIFSAIGNALGEDNEHGLRGVFKTATNAIESIWNGLRAVFAAPIRFMVDTVLNKGLIAAFNWVAGKIPGTDLQIDPIVLPDALYPKGKDHPGGFAAATGGILPGYTPGRDVHHFYSPTAGSLELSGGEPILRPEVGRVVGSKWVDGINGAAIRGGTRGVQRFLGGFDKGGILGGLGKIGRTVGKVWDVVTSPADYLRDRLDGFVGRLDSLGDGALAQVVKAVPKAIGTMLVDALTGVFSGGGGGGGGGPVNPGLDGALEWARSQVGKPYIWGGVGPRGFDCSGFQSAIVNVIQGRDPYSRRFATGSLPAGLFEPGPGAYEIGWFTGNPGHTAGTLNGVNVESRGGEGVVVGPNARGAGDSLFNHRGHLKGYASGGVFSMVGEGRRGDSAFDYLAPRGKHTVPDLRDLIDHAKLYDSGGYLQPGYTLAYNGTSAPEPVMTSGGFEQLVKAAQDNAQTRSGDFIYNAAPSRSAPADEVLAAQQRAAFFGFGGL